eukprot:TRINITY_DN1562_c0_g2_i1.p1 TRINITY_DN1562_c0_g2~~TRINITY_DN1562_c0_g2_i1.p1  ORF type:complete len:846 (+),score=338.08 TRINITY_DN1562_c0_g2_i1:264-2540(+)
MPITTLPDVVGSSTADASSFKPKGQPAAAAGGPAGQVNARALIASGGPLLQNGTTKETAVLQRPQFLCQNRHSGGRTHLEGYGGLVDGSGGDAAVARRLAALVQEQCNIDLSGVTWHKLVEMAYVEGPPTVWYLPAVWELGGKIKAVIQALEEDVEMLENYDAEVVDEVAERALRAREEQEKAARLLKKRQKRRDAALAEFRQRCDVEKAAHKRKRDEEDEGRKRARIEKREAVEKEMQEECEGLTEDEVQELEQTTKRKLEEVDSSCQAEEQSVQERRAQEDKDMEQGAKQKERLVVEEVDKGEISDTDAPAPKPAPMKMVTKQRKVTRVRKTRVIEPHQASLFTFLETAQRNRDRALWELFAAVDLYDEFVKRELVSEMMGIFKQRKEWDRIAQEEMRRQEEQQKTLQQRKLALQEKRAQAKAELLKKRQEEDAANTARKEQLAKDFDTKKAETAAAREKEDAEIRQARKEKDDKLTASWREDEEGLTEEEIQELRKRRQGDRDVLHAGEAKEDEERAQSRAKEDAEHQQQLENALQKHSEAERELQQRRKKEDADTSRAETAEDQKMENDIKPRQRRPRVLNGRAFDTFAYFDRFRRLHPTGRLSVLQVETLLMANADLSVNEVRSLLGSSNVGKAIEKGSLHYKEVCKEETPETPAKSPVKEAAVQPPKDASRSPAKAGQSPAKAGQSQAKAGQSPAKGGGSPAKAAKSPAKAVAKSPAKSKSPAKAGRSPAKAQAAQQDAAGSADQQDEENEC